MARIPDLAFSPVKWRALTKVMRSLLGLSGVVVIVGRELAGLDCKSVRPSLQVEVRLQVDRRGSLRPVQY